MHKEEYGDEAPAGLRLVTAENIKRRFFCNKPFIAFSDKGLGLFLGKDVIRGSRREPQRGETVFCKTRRVPSLVHFLYTHSVLVTMPFFLLQAQCFTVTPQITT